MGVHGGRKETACDAKVNTLNGVIHGQLHHHTPIGS